MNDNNETQQPEATQDEALKAAQAAQLSPQQLGGIWANDAVREILAKPPETAQFELHALQFMAISILAGEAYNHALGLGEVKQHEAGKKPNGPMSFNEFKMKQIIRLFAQHIENGVIRIRAMASRGELTKLESTTEAEPQEESSKIILTDANDGGTDEKGN